MRNFLAISMYWAWSPGMAWAMEGLIRPGMGPAGACGGAWCCMAAGRGGRLLPGMPGDAFSCRCEGWILVESLTCLALCLGVGPAPTPAELGVVLCCEVGVLMRSAVS